MIKYSDLCNIEGFLESSGPIVSEALDIVLSTDTRTIKLHESFMAIEGVNFKPLSFVDRLPVEVKLIFCEENDFNQEIIKEHQNLSFIIVENSIKYFQSFASLIAKRFVENGNQLIAISGSNGKTTTKEMLFHILASVEPLTVCTQRNNNNHIGVPLTLLQITKSTKFCILELGSNHPGEIKALCEIANPNIGITTNIGDTHLEFFGGQEEVFREEGYLYHSIELSNHKFKKYFQNMDDDFLKKNAINKDVVTYGKLSNDYNLNCEFNTADLYLNGVKYVLNNQHVTGKHNFFNLCVATIISEELLDCSSSRICEYANSFIPTSNRSEWIDYNTGKVFLDAYNANPTSMHVSIEGFHDEILSSQIDTGECLLILGDMNELGNDAARFHKEIGNLLNRLNFSKVYFVGQNASNYNKGFGGSAQEFLDVKEAIKEFKLIKNNFKRIFIKGSRSLQLESILDIK